MGSTGASPGDEASRLRAELAEARREAEASRRRLSEIESLTGLGSWEWDFSEKPAEWSEQLHRIFGVALGEPIPTFEGFLDFVHPEDREILRERVRRSFEEGAPYQNRYRVIAPGREGREVESTARIVTDDADRPVRGYGATLDITERSETENKLRIQADLLEQLDVAVMASDTRRRLTHWNSAAERMLGVPRSEALGRTLNDVLEIPPESREHRAAMVTRVSRGQTWEGELTLYRADGSIFPALASNAPVRDEADEIVGYVGAIMDLSEVKEAHAELRDAVADLERSRRETIHRLSRAVESRDTDTGGHIERIGELAALIGERLGLEHDRVQLLRIASPMHDVGKIGIADSILRKPGPLTPAEREEMQQHTLIGHEILAGSESELLDLAAEIALTHHERMDGSGYPRGLRGDEIPLEGRIAAVVDVFDALTSDRVYRPAYPIEEAIEIMARERGTGFDPDPLDALLDDPATLC